ncbi:hypothetical protein [Geoalkalibacter halelectricus]|uniref:hypothetical protein n=1 Tax=Geoalkalibacter halelectricus TaxID=2847045 RepID=UPI00266EDF77|nr:hypothetical protein [Geoalkalibacter halelectricus]MDO3380446.1 hypothetical protein [Geoalkalibacter halelectricus]
MSSAADLPREIKAALSVFQGEHPHLGVPHLKLFFAVAAQHRATREKLSEELKVAPSTFDFLYAAMGPPRFGSAKEWRCYLVKAQAEDGGMGVERYELTQRGKLLNIKLTGAMQKKPFSDRPERQAHTNKTAPPEMPRSQASENRGLSRLRGRRMKG